jgi:regulator of sirC expression with transglutaminase-like and TPR domain
MADKDSREIDQKRRVQAFKALIAQEDSQIDLARAALLIASIKYPDLNETQSLIYLDELARRVRTLLALPEPEVSPQLPDDVKPLVVIDALNKVLFEDEQFHGNQDDYYNPNNSFLNKVLELHTGIPITLSLLYIEIGRRVGIQIDGIGFPYHFMVRHQWDHSVVYIDPFAGGTLLTEQDCEEHLRRIARHRVRLHPQWFQPITRRHMLIRMLNNLKHIYVDKEDYEHGLAICDLIILLLPQAATERRDRGLMHLQLKHYGRALHDLKAYLELAPEAEDRYEIRAHLKTIRETLAMLN